MTAGSFHKVTAALEGPYSDVIAVRHENAIYALLSGPGYEPGDVVYVRGRGNSRPPHRLDVYSEPRAKTLIGDAVCIDSEVEGFEMVDI